MALPVLQAPKYETTIPSSGKVITFRPFLVKEEKILMMAQETNDTDQVVSAMKEIIKSCTFNKVEPNELTLFDAEFLFIQLRAKSVGETVKFMLKCEECGTPNEVTLSLEDVKVQFPEKEVDSKIELADDIGITLKPIGLKNAINFAADTDDVTKILCSVIDTIYDDSNVYNSDNTTTKELIDFIDSLSHDHIAKIQEYIENLPTLKHDVAFQCMSCKAKNEVTLRGLQDFFG